MTQRMTDKKRFKKFGRLVQEMLRDNIHGATVEGTRQYAIMREIDATLDGIRVPGEEPEEKPDAIDGE